MPVHDWDLPELGDLEEYRPQGLRVEEFMTTDLFTVQKDDIIELVAEMMDWRKVRHAPVEDDKGKLIGLVSIRLILRFFVVKDKVLNEEKSDKVVGDIMIPDPITIGPKATIVDAMRLMRENKIGSLPVVQNGDLIGIITEMDFLRISSRLIERLKANK